ncbi:HAD-IA family hydrolase [Streptomyces sp. MI02-7b]|uniref:HAD-IA family hydrolase n=1 Tax=Streptomyces sp. MI02-7b TaxID=462941 RepID=UPI0029ACECE1|nr:HAD-IA family hydrolase [Streptomyces sp. MI02-7b]MDX3075814.1 HAD-IA family hydrolase [Streptomyces sp. MI02-7b]
MTLRPPATRYDAVVLDYNGVLGKQPTASAWANLAALASWPADRVTQFQQAFWSRRDGYDAGVISDAQFWVSGMVQRTDRTFASLLPELIKTDVAMWTTVDPAVIHLLRAAHRAGTKFVLLSNAPHALAEALDMTEWSCSLMARSVYSARIGINKPAKQAYEAALAAAGWPDPERVLFVDDRAENTAAAARLGMNTLHYTGNLGALAEHLPQLYPAPAIQQVGAAVA